MLLISEPARRIHLLGHVFMWWCYKIYIFHVWRTEISCVTKQLSDFQEELLVGVPINGWQCWLVAKFVWHKCLQTLCAITVSAKVWMFKLWILVCSAIKKKFKVTMWHGPNQTVSKNSSIQETACSHTHKLHS